MKILQFLWVVSTFSTALFAQQTIFNVPSADVLDRGQVYGELDATYQHSSDTFGLTPRLVVGLGHRFEAGINFNGLVVPGKQTLTPTPSVKWKIIGSSQNGWSWLAGDDVFLPAQNRTYSSGNYVWTEAARSWRSGTRVTVGIYHATENVFESKQKVGGQFAFEQPLSHGVTFATDWYTGDCFSCYITPGVVIKVTNRITWYGSYQIGNHRAVSGNHQLLTEIGWNLK